MPIVLPGQSDNTGLSNPRVTVVIRITIMEGQGAPPLSRRNSVRSNTGSRRQSLEGEGAGDQGANMFGQMKPLKKSKPVSTVKITFMGKPMVIYYF